MQLTRKQEEALYNMKNGKNVFLTGPAGTGKTYLLKYFIDWYRTKNMEDLTDKAKYQKIYITSTTGLSAILIDGITIHRYAGIGLGDKDVDFLYNKIIKVKKLRRRWQHTEVLIIDEISMMDPILFDKLEELARRIRRNDEPFGGIQIILSGDFLQLPPVNSSLFCFESNSWRFIDETFYFNEILRQNNNILQNVLNKIRVGKVDEEVCTLLDSCIGKNLIHDDNIIPTLLFSVKQMVLQYNGKELKKLIDVEKRQEEYIATYEITKKTTIKEAIKKPSTKTLKLRDTTKKTIKSTSKEDNDNSDDDKTELQKPDEFYKDLINSQYQIEDKITLTIDTQVMLTVNLPDEELANGSKGIVIDFDEMDYPIVRFTNKKTLVIREHTFTLEEDKMVVIKKQLPLMLAWAITIHKAQGMTLEYIKTDIGSSIFEYGQAYVVLSRIKDISGLSLVKIDYSKIKAHPKILHYYESLET